MTQYNKLRTIVYVDGYNLYYSMLTGSPYKWLDLYALMADVLKDAYPGVSAHIEHIKFFTAPIMARYASDPESPNRQTRYHNALKFAPSGSTEVIAGKHSEVTKKGYPVEAGVGNGEPIWVSVMEEKQTDVNIGLHMYRDASRDAVEQVVLVSGDSDLAPALQLIRDDFPQIVRGLVFPILDSKPNARRSGSLEKLAHWTRNHLTVAQLEACQLPLNIPNRKGKAIKKPDCW